MSGVESINPKLTIGLPVYNGANYLADTLDSLLAQTFTDFELLISDNASTDETETICRDYAARDSRIVYMRNQKNLGAAANYNQVFEKARGEYFKWSGHDDPVEADFLDKSVAVLNAHPSVKLCYAKIKVIDEQGKARPISRFHFGHFKAKPQLQSSRPHRRFYHAVVASHPPGAIFGVMRRSLLEPTPLIGSYISSDLPLLGELALRGKFYEIPEYLLTRRVHAAQPWMASRDRSFRESWFDPARVSVKTHPQWRLFQEHCRAIARAAPDQKTRFICYGYMVLWVLKYPLCLVPLKPVLRKLQRCVAALDRGNRLSKWFVRKQHA